MKKEMTINEGAEYVMNQLNESDIAYASDPARGEYRGFAALHDLMDANMLLPEIDDDCCMTDDLCSYYNEVMDAVSDRIINK